VGDLLSTARELERSLADLLGLLDSRKASPQALDGAARACADGFEALRASIEAGTVEGAEVESVLRTHAIARDLAASHQAELTNVLDRVRAARRNLAHYGDETTPGDSCDIAG
jgi:hypothetical protein